nr:RNA-directed DNA polymerase, eukaryota [Tanacetum cinerariifolium]
AWFLNFQEDDQDDLSSDGESQEGDVAIKLIIIRVMLIEYQNRASCMKMTLLTKMSTIAKTKSDEPKFPPGFTLDNNDQEKNVEENIKDTTERVQSLSNKLNDRCSNCGFSSQRSMNSHSQKSKVCRSILDLMDELVTVGQTMGYNMAGIWAPTSSKLLIISVYAPQELNGRRNLWDYLRTFIDRWEGDIVIMGDFNEVRSEHERHGAIAFNNFISSACLIDLPLEGYAFTCAHKSASKMSKLDRYFISEGVLDLFLHLSALCLDRHLSDHRPIILRETNYDYGPSLFCDVQLAFVTNRQILDGPFILNELLSWGKFKKLNGMIFNVDFKKAFDSVKWDYLDETLKAFSFGSKWRNWINSCLNNAMRLVLVNGSHTLEFQFYKGLKQGFIGEWNTNNIQTLLSVLRCFYLDSGLKINLHKSKLMGIGVSSNVVAAAASLIGCSILTAPFNYVGVKVVSNMSRITSCDDVIFKVSSRLSKWKLKLLFIGGRLSLLKSVLTSIPLYHMYIFKVPIGVLNHLESIRQNLFDGVDGSDRKLALIMISVKENPKKDKIGSKPDKNGKRDETEKSQKQLQSPWQDVILAINSLQSKGEVALKVLYKRLYALEMCKSISVAEKIGHPSLSHSFRRMPKGDVERENYGLLCLKVADLGFIHVTSVIEDNEDLPSTRSLISPFSNQSILQMGFIHVTSVIEDNEDLPSTRSGLSSLYREAKRARKLLIISGIGNQNVLPLMVSPEGAIRCYDTVSLSQKLSLHRHAKVPISLHIFVWNQVALRTQIHSPVALLSLPPPQTQTARAVTSNQVVPLGINPQDDDMLDIRLDRDTAGEDSFRFYNYSLPNNWVSLIDFIRVHCI